MIVVVGVPSWRTGDAPGPDGRSARIALAAAEGGADVELVGRVGDDPAGDALVLALTRGGVGHAAILRDPSRSTPTVSATDDDALIVGSDAPGSQPAPSTAAPSLDAGDLELGLRYLADYRVVIVADPLPDRAVQATVDAAAYAGAALIVLARAGASGEATPEGATVLETPEDDDGSFARLVAAYAVALDRGEPAAAAFQAAVAGTGWESSTD